MNLRNRLILPVMLLVWVLSACTGGQPATTTQPLLPAETLPATQAELPVSGEAAPPSVPITPTAVPVETKTVVDSRGVEVVIPKDPQRVLTVSDALVEEVMTVFGVAERVSGIGSTCLVRDFTYDFETAQGEKFSYSGGMNPANYLNPDLIERTMFVKPGTEMNYETLASLEPDVLIIDVGACTLPWKTDQEAMRQGLARLESLGVPVVVLMGPNSGGSLKIEALSAVIRILGGVFDKQTQAEQLAAYLEDSIRLVSERTSQVAPEERPSVLLLGLNPDVRAEGGVGNAVGRQDIQSYFVEEIVHARNAFEQDSSALLNPEQILAINPDVIILPTANGFHPPRELYELNHFSKIQTLDAIQNRRVGALPWSPCNCDKRLEYPLDVMIIAKTVYPDLFSDIVLSDWILQFYQDVYGVSEQEAMGLLQAQWLDWTLEE